MSTKIRLVIVVAIGLGLWGTVNLLLSRGLLAEQIQHLAITPLRTHLGPDVTVDSVQLTVVPTRLVLKNVVIPPFGDATEVLSAPVRVDTITMTFSPWSLLTEALILPRMTIKGIHASLRSTHEHLGPSAPLGIPFLLSKYWPRDVVLRDVAFSDLDLDVALRPHDRSYRRWHMTGIEGRLRSDFAMENFHLNVSAGAAELQFASVAKAPLRFVQIKSKMLLRRQHLEIKNFSVGGTVGHIAFRGAIDNPEAPVLALYMDVRSSVDDLRGLQLVKRMPVSIDRLNGRVHLRGEIVGAWPDIRARGNFDVAGLRVGAKALGDPRGRFRFERGHLTVHDVSTNLFGGHLDGNIDMQWQREKPPHTQIVLGYDGHAGGLQLSGTLEGTHMDLALKGATRNVGEFARFVEYPEPLAGQLDFSGTVRGDVREPEIRGRVAIRDLMAKGRFIDSASATLAYRRGTLDVVKAIVRQGAGLFDIEGTVLFPEGEGASPSVDLAVTTQHGSLREVIALIYKELPIPEQANGTMLIHTEGTQNFSVTGSVSLPAGQAFGERFDHGDLDFTLDPRGVSFTRLYLRQGRGTFQGEGWIGFDGTFRGSLRGQGLDVQNVNWIRTHASSLEGRASVHLMGSGSIDRPVIHGAARFHQLRYHRAFLGNGRADIETRGSQSTLIASFNRGVQLNAGIGWEGERPFTASATFSNFDASSLVRDPKSTANTLSLTSTGVLSVEGDLAHWKDAVVVGRFPAAHAGINGYHLRNEEPLEGTFRDGVVSIDRFQVVGENTAVGITGHVVPFEEYDLNVAGNVSPQLAQLLMSDITVQEGTGVLDLKVSEHWDAPDVTGTYNLRDLVLHCRLSEQPIIIPSMEIQVNNGSVNIQSFAGRVGHGQVEANGMARVADWRMSEFLLNAKVSDVQYVTEPGLVATLQGDVRFEGQHTLQKITGDLTIANIASDARGTVKDFLVNDVQPLLLSPRRSTSDHAVEIDIHATGREDLRFENPLARLPLDVDLLVQGTLHQPELSGRVGSRGGIVFFGKRQFDVVDAGIDFVAHQDHRALYSVHARSQLRPYDVDLFLSGIDDKVNVTLTSEPPLDEAVILAYLEEEGHAYDPMFQQNRRQGSWHASNSSLASEGAVRTLLSHRVDVEKRVLADRLYALLSTPAVPADEQLIRLQYPVSENLSFVGERNEEGRVVGDVRYRIEFP